MRHYIIGDVHNDSVKLRNLLSKLMLKSSDKVYFLGDLFDRCDNHADPLGVYEAVKELGEQADVVMGNHDLWLLGHIKAYLSTNSSLKGYPYNTFDIIRATLTREELFKLSEFVNLFSLQLSITIDDNNYLLAHAMTHIVLQNARYHTMGLDNRELYFTEGIPGYISIVGHHYVVNMTRYGGTYSDKHNPSVWINDKKNVIMADTGSGYPYGRLCALCLENNAQIYT